MRLAILSMLLCILAVILCGCLLTDRYTTEEPVIDPATGQPMVDPDTGEPLTRQVQQPSPLEDGIRGAAGGFAQGGWVGALIGGVPALAWGLWKAYQAEKGRTAAQKAAALADALKPMVSDQHGAVLRQVLDRAGQDQEAAGVRNLIRSLRRSKA